MESLTLYSYRRCPFAIRVRMVLEEKRIPYQRIEENLSNLSAELLSLHPEGRVPLLVHKLRNKEIVIYQSSIITEYLDETFSQNSLMPQDSISRAQVRLWTYWCDQIFKPDLDLYKYDFAKMETDKKADLSTRLNQLLTHWNSQLKLSPFLLGNELTLADIHLFPFARQFFACRPPFENSSQYTHLHDWLARIVGRPSFEKVMGK